jgi:hypothetical protein
MPDAALLHPERIAMLLETVLLRFDGGRYRILAWCIISNNAHAAVEIWEDYPLDEVMQMWMSCSVHEANKRLHPSGRSKLSFPLIRRLRNNCRLPKPHEGRTLKNYSSLAGAEFCLKILEKVLKQDLVVATEK